MIQRRCNKWMKTKKKYKIKTRICQITQVINISNKHNLQPMKQIINNKKMIFKITILKLNHQLINTMKVINNNQIAKENNFNKLIFTIKNKKPKYRTKINIKNYKFNFYILNLNLHLSLL